MEKKIVLGNNFYMGYHSLPPPPPPPPPPGCGGGGGGGTIFQNVYVGGTQSNQGFGWELGL